MIRHNYRQRNYTGGRESSPSLITLEGSIAGPYCARCPAPAAPSITRTRDADTTLYTDEAITHHPADIAERLFGDILVCRGGARVRCGCCKRLELRCWSDSPSRWALGARMTRLPWTRRRCVESSPYNPAAAVVDLRAIGDEGVLELFRRRDRRAQDGGRQDKAHPVRRGSDANGGAAFDSAVRAGQVRAPHCLGCPLCSCAV